MDHAGRQAGPGDRGADEAEVDVARGDRLDLVGGDQFAQHQVDVRELFRDPPQERLHVPVDRHGGEADRQGSARARRDAPHGERAFLRQPQDAPGLGEEYPPGRRDLDRAAGAVEQDDADFLFEQPDLAAERRLSQVQARGGPAEVEFLGDRHEAG